MSNVFLSLRCPDCGKKIAEADSLCPHCGVALDAPLGEIERHVLAQQYIEKAQKTYDSERNMKGALADADIALQFEPESAEAHNLRGLILDAMGKTEDAINSYHEAIRLNPILEDAKANLMDAESELRNEPRKAISSGSDQEDVLPKIIIGFVGIVIVVCVIAGMGLIYLLGRDYIGPKNTVIFEPDYSQISTMDSSVLEKTAEILTERARSLGYSKISFVVTDDKQIVGKIPSYIDAKVLVERISPIGLLEFVNFGEAPLPEGTVISTDLENMYTQQTDEKKWHTVMTNNGILVASAIKSQTGEFQISFALTDDGKKIFADYTTANTGTYLGIVLDKVIISVPIIQMPILDGQGMISGSFTQEKAEDLAVILGTTPLPIPIKLIQDVDSVK